MIWLRLYFECRWQILALEVGAGEAFAESGV